MTSILCVVILVVTASDTVAQSATPTSADWPFVRGAHFDGHSAETDLADSWPTDGPPVLWTRELGQGYSSFVAWDDRVATQAQTLAGQAVLCLDANTGRTIWEYRYDWPYDPAGIYPGPRATPTYSNGRVYFAAPDGTIGCLDAKRGRLHWSTNPTREFNGQGTGFGYSCSPTVVEGMVILPIGGRGASMIALDSHDGTLVWKSGDDPASYTPAYPINFRGRRLVVGYLQNALVVHDLSSGALVWRKELSHGYDEHSAWPIYREPYLWTSSPFQAGSELMELTGDTETPFKIVWTSRQMSNDIFSSVLVDDHLYGFDLREAQAKAHRPSRGQFRCLEFLTGKQTWETGHRSLPGRGAEKESAADRIGHAAFLVADQKLILMNDSGELILARANPTRYEELGRISLLSGEIYWTQPILHRGRLFVRNQSRAACVYLGKAGTLALDAPALTTRDIPQTTYVDWTAMILGVEPEYAFDLPSKEWLNAWFRDSIWILITAMGSALLLRLACGPKLSEQQLRLTFWCLAFILGVAGTTWISLWRSDFVFTWPVALFIVFQANIQVASTARVGRRDWREWIAALAFIASCLAYYLMCKRLSLVFEWVFLCGFPGALPFSLLGGKLFGTRRWRIVWEAALTLIAFAGFYWFAVAVLLLKN